MQNEPAEAEDADEEYFVLPEEAFQHLPDDLRNQFEAMAEDGRTVLRSVDKELNQAGRISRSMIDIVALKHVRDRLSEYRFSPYMESLLELDMLITAFVITYVRLQQGGAGSGFDRAQLPEHLLPKHDEIIDLRNKRFAHSDEHHTVFNMMEISYSNGRFEVSPSLNLRVQIGGAPEWKELVDTVEAIYSDRSEKLLARISKKTGYEWGFAKAPQGDAEH
jgi:hypothetical protein